MIDVSDTPSQKPGPRSTSGVARTMLDSGYAEKIADERSKSPPRPGHSPRVGVVRKTGLPRTFDIKGPRPATDREKGWTLGGPCNQQAAPGVGPGSIVTEGSRYLPRLHDNYKAQAQVARAQAEARLKEVQMGSTVRASRRPTHAHTQLLQQQRNSRPSPMPSPTGPSR
jgi:hypothetical protein